MDSDRQHERRPGQLYGNLAAGWQGPGGRRQCEEWEWGDGDRGDLRPATGTWSPTGSLNVPRVQHTATLLNNGKVLVAGDPTGAFSCELYDPATGLWSFTGSLAAERYGHTATLLADGKVLVAGGHGDNINSLQTSEIYDPDTETWSSGGDLVDSRAFHAATLLPDGEVLLTGGDNNTKDVLTTAELGTEMATTER